MLASKLDKTNTQIEIPDELDAWIAGGRLFLTEAGSQEALTSTPFIGCDYKTLNECIARITPGALSRVQVAKVIRERQEFVLAITTPDDMLDINTEQVDILTRSL